MATPWHSPSIPAAPNPTPTTLLSRHASLRPPIYNPYDKFTRPQFDAWIDDITGALKRALGREEEAELSPPKGERVNDALMRARDAAEDASRPRPVSSQEDDTDGFGNKEDPSILEDSFAHVKSRRAKGKARDPRDGPGLGGKDQPIELLSDSESDQSANVDLEKEWQEGSEEEGSEEEYDEEEYDEESDEGTDQYAPGGSGTHATKLVSVNDETEDEDLGVLHGDQDEMEDDRVDEDEGEAQDEIIESGEEENGSGTWANRPRPHKEALIEHARPLPEAPPSLDEHGPEGEEYDTVELPDPWEDPRTYAEDFYSGLVDSDGLDELDDGPQRQGDELNSMFPGLPYDALTASVPHQRPGLNQTSLEGNNTSLAAQYQPLDDQLAPTAFVVAELDRTVVPDKVSTANTPEGDEDELDSRDVWVGIPVGTSDFDVKDGWDEDVHGEESEKEDNVRGGNVHDGVSPANPTVECIHVDELYASPPHNRNSPSPKYTPGSLIDLPDEQGGFGLLPPSESPSPPQEADRGQIDTRSAQFDELLAELDKRELGQLSSDVEFILQDIDILAGVPQVAPAPTTDRPTAFTATTDMRIPVDTTEVAPSLAIPLIHDTSVFDIPAAVQDDQGATGDSAIVSNSPLGAPSEPVARSRATDDGVENPMRVTIEEVEDEEYAVWMVGNNNPPSVDEPTDIGVVNTSVVSPDDAPYTVEKIDKLTDESVLDQDGDLDEAISVATNEIGTLPIDQDYTVQETETVGRLTQEPEAKGEQDLVMIKAMDSTESPKVLLDVFTPGDEDINDNPMEPNITTTLPEGQEEHDDTALPLDFKQHPTLAQANSVDEPIEYHVIEEAPVPKELEEVKIQDSTTAVNTTAPHALPDGHSFRADGNSSTVAEPPTDLALAQSRDEMSVSAEVSLLGTSQQTQSSDIIPAPVSADPTVPDPASPVPSPQSPTLSLPTSPSSSTRASTGIPFAIPTSVVKALDLSHALSSGHSNGLFTPVNGATDGTPAPSEGGSEPLAGITTPTPIVEVPVDEGAEAVSAGEAPAPDRSKGTTALADSKKISAQNADEVSSTVVDNAAPLSPSMSPDGQPSGIVKGNTVKDHHQAQPPPEGASSVMAAPPATVDVDVDSLYDDLPLTYPDSGEESVQYQSPPVGGDPSIGQDSDEDADGEIDPDYLPTSERETQSAEIDPFTLMGNDSTIAPGAVENDQPNSSESTSNSDTGDAFTLKPAPSECPAHLPSEDGHTPSPQRSVDLVPEPSEGEHSLQGLIPGAPSSRHTPITVADPTLAATSLSHPADEAAHAAAKPSVGKPSSPPKQLKRKRPSPVASSSRLTRSKSKSDQTAESSQSGSSHGKKQRGATRGKGKHSKAEKDSPEESTDDENPSQSSASSAVQRLLAPSSRTGSVVSTASTDSVSATQSANRRLPGVHPPLVHTHIHAFIHHHHGRGPPPPPPPPPPAPRQESQSKTPALSRAASEDAQASATSPTSSQRPSPVKRLPSLNSPVTRSNCRFHKISLPREEGGPRLSFIVPGCSLGDGELMEEEEIVDHGFATIEDHGRMIPDIESLDFNPYTVGVLRQLVGVDLLREQEVFYLPNPGEELPTKRRKKKSRKSVVEKVKAFHRQSMPQDVRAPGSPRISELSRRSSTPSSSSASRSVGDSVSVAGSSFRIEDSIAGSEGDASDDEEPRPKRRKVSPVPDGESPSSAPSLAGPSSQPSKLRRSRRKPLNVDAAAYKPGKDDSASEDADDDIGPSSRKSKGRKSTKRSRTLDDVAGDGPKPKKSRLRKSISTSVTGLSGDAE